MNSSPHILIIAPIESVIFSGYYASLFHKLSLHLKTVGIDVTVLSLKPTKGEGVKFNTQQLSWLRYCVDNVEGCDIHNNDLECFRAPTHRFQKFQTFVMGSMQIFRQCWHQKPSILQIYHPLHYGLMALPTSLILGIPMILVFGSQQESCTPKAWIKKIVLKCLVKWSKTVVASSKQLKKELRAKFYEREVVVILGDSSKYVNSSVGRFQSVHWEQVISPDKIQAHYWQKTINHWCNVFKETSQDQSFKPSYFWVKRNTKSEVSRSSHESSSHQFPPQALYPARHKYWSSVVNLTYYKNRELRKIIS